jgi:hypothetical protein
MSIIKVKSAAIGWTMSIAESVVLVELGKSKVAVSESENSLSIIELAFDTF